MHYVSRSIYFQFLGYCKELAKNKVDKLAHEMIEDIKKKILLGPNI
jgi:hypothetical protein